MADYKYTEIKFTKDNNDYRLVITDASIPHGDLYINGVHKRAFLWGGLGHKVWYKTLVNDACKKAKEIAGSNLTVYEYKGLPKY